MDTPHIGGSIYYKEQIADLLNNVAKDFEWNYDRHTLELKYKNR